MAWRCDQIKFIMGMRLFDTLEPEQRIDTNIHLLGCPACRQWVRACIAALREELSPAEVRSAEREAATLRARDQALMVRPRG